MRPPLAWYREFRPCAALEADVYAFFSFTSEPSTAPADRPLRREVVFADASFCSPQFADGHPSILFELGRTCGAAGWYDDGRALGATVSGPMTGVGRIEGRERPEMFGILFRPGRLTSLLGVPARELLDRSTALDSVWGRGAASLAEELRGCDEGRRIDRIEAILLARLTQRRDRTGLVDVSGLARAVLRRNGHVTVSGLARAAGVSRQHLTREFRERLGVPPKLYGRLARFHAALAYAGRPAAVDWAAAAADMGYADQSHLIAEFRQFSGLTPETLVQRYWFHPFIERARDRV